MPDPLPPSPPNLPAADPPPAPPASDGPQSYPPKSWFDAALAAARREIADGALAAARARLEALQALSDGGAMGPHTLAGLPRRLHSVWLHLARAEGEIVAKAGWQATQVPPPALMRSVSRLTEQERAQARALAAAPVPRVLHQIWIGPRPLPVNVARWRQHAGAVGYGYRLWREADLEPLGVMQDPAFQAMLAQGDYPGAVDIARYAVLAAKGGIYLDVDWYPLTDTVRFEEYAPLTGLMVLAEPTPRVTGAGAVMLANSVIGAPEGHPVMRALPRAARTAMQALPQAPAWWVTGPLLFTVLARQVPLTLWPEALSGADLSGQAEQLRRRYGLGLPAVAALSADAPPPHQTPVPEADRPEDEAFMVTWKSW